MEVRYLIVARYAEFTADGKLNLIGGDIDKYYFDEYPSIVPVIHAAAKLTLDREDTLTEHSFRSIIRDEQDETIAEGVEGTFHSFHMPKEMTYLGAGLILSFGPVILPKAGLYRILLFIDEKVVKESHFRVMTRDQEKKLHDAAKNVFQEKSDGNTSTDTDQ